MKQATRPTPFDFKDYREYLVAYFSWLKRTHNMSMRKLAGRLGVSVALLSSIVNGRRNLTGASVRAWSEVLGWSEQEISFLEKQLHFQDEPDRRPKTQAFKEILRFKRYKERNVTEVVAWSYLANWWTPVIREMSGLVEFQENPQWIRGRLRFPIALEEIRKCLAFLRDNNLLARQGDFRRIECHGGVYKLALAQFHGQILERAADSIYKAQSEERHILGHTYRLHPKKMGKLKLILDRALEEISALESPADVEGEVYHVALTAVPMTKKVEKK